MNIYKQEFKMHFKSMVIWSLSIACLIFVYLAIYPSFAKDAELLNRVLSSFPKEFLIAFGMTDVDLSNIVGFYGLVFLFVQICLSIQAANYGFSLVSIEETELTADFLLAKPVRRTQILTSKLLAAITCLTITNIVVWISSFVFLNTYSGGKAIETKPIILLLLSIVIFQAFFFSVGMLISLLVKRIRSVTPYSMALAFGMYVLNAFGGMIGKETLEIISPFKHFEPNYIIKHSGYNFPMAWISVSAILISVVGSYVLYSKRNIRSAV
ncbi:MAG TPA: ABC transporter permease subunit [Anaerolineae bacterium]|nr:ABC transporter permease subunit [Anaerolineae bacterium]